MAGNGYLDPPADGRIHGFPLRESNLATARKVFFSRENGLLVGSGQIFEFPATDFIPGALEFDEIDPMAFENMLKRRGVDHPVDAVVKRVHTVKYQAFGMICKATLWKTRAVLSSTTTTSSSCFGAIPSQVYP